MSRGPAKGPELDMDFDIEPGSPEVKENLDTLRHEIDGPELEEMTDEQLRESVDDINEGLVDYLKIKSKSESKEEAKRAKLQLEVYDDVLELFDDIRPLIEGEKFEKAEKKTVKFLGKMEKKFKKQDVTDEKVLEAIQQTQDLINLYGEMLDVTRDRPTVGMTLLSGGIDLIPFVGGAKITAEGFIGRSMTGEKYGIFKRLFKMGEGVFWIAVDTAGVIVGLGSFGSGAVAVEGAAIAAKGAKAAKAAKGVGAAAKASKTARGVSMGAAAMRAANKTGKGAKTLASVARFAAKHPKLVSGAQRAIKVGKTVDSIDYRTQFNVAKAITRKPVDWTKRKLVLHRFRQEREEFVAALGQTLDTDIA